MLGPASAVAGTVWMGLICDFSYLVGEDATRPSDSGTVSWPGDWLGVSYSILCWPLFSKGTPPRIGHTFGGIYGVIRSWVQDFRRVPPFIC